MITIYHNKRCGKSREGLQFLIENNIQHEIVFYFENLLTEVELSLIIEKLNINPIDLVRIKEKIWIAEFKNKQLNNTEIIAAMVKYPNLIERAIVVNGTKAIIARSIDKIHEVI